MDNTKLVKEWAKENAVNLDTVSFYCDLDGEQHDSEYGYCDVSGEQCMVSSCTAALRNGTIIQFDASEDLIGGALGKLARAF